MQRAQIHYSLASVRIRTPLEFCHPSFLSPQSRPTVVRSLGRQPAGSKPQCPQPGRDDSVSMRRPDVEPSGSAQEAPELRLLGGGLRGCSGPLILSSAIGTPRCSACIFILPQPCPASWCSYSPRRSHFAPLARGRLVANCPSWTGHGEPAKVCRGHTLVSISLTQVKNTPLLKNFLLFPKVMRTTVFVDFSFRFENYLSW